MRCDTLGGCNVVVCSIHPEICSTLLNVSKCILTTTLCVYCTDLINLGLLSQDMELMRVSIRNIDTSDYFSIEAIICTATGSVSSLAAMKSARDEGC